MQIITKLDKLFLKVYSGIILVVGIGVAMASGKIYMLAVTVGVLSVYLFFALRAPLRRYRALKQPLPDIWRGIVADFSVFYNKLDQENKLRFEKDMLLFMNEFSIEGIRRTEIDLRSRLLIAAAFATMLHGRPEWEPPIRDGVIVYPGDRFNREYKIGKGNYAGIASPNSPLIVTEQSLHESFLYPEDGNNVIFHELAHYFDMEDGRAEGIPSARLPADKLEEWKEMITWEWNRVRRGDSFLRPYAGTNEAELFAVAVEVFFEDPLFMKNNNRQMYYAFRDFFNIDPYTARIPFGRPVRMELLEIEE